MTEQRLTERQKARKRLDQLVKLRDSVGHGNEWLDVEINELEAFLREKEEQPV